MELEAIILAGGKGTRLRDRVSDRPKPMALVGERPFLEYILRQLEKQGVKRVVLSVGYMYESICSHFGSNWRSLKIDYSIEHEPQGTGGGIRDALKKIQGEECWVLNGDSIVDVNLRDLWSFHQSQTSDLTLTLKLLEIADRYGTVVQEDGRVLGFNERGKNVQDAWINAGVYLVRKKTIATYLQPGHFSFEANVLPQAVHDLAVCGLRTNCFFIDIGVPQDFERAQSEAYLKGLFL